jgi:hypothetical protein
MKASLEQVSLSQTTTRCLFARVTATLIRLLSARNPTSLFSLDLTRERMIASFSPPWNPSTVRISRRDFSTCSNEANRTRKEEKVRGRKEAEAWKWTKTNLLLTLKSHPTHCHQFHSLHEQQLTLARVPTDHCKE